jgi:hypothetical protein
MSRRDRSVWRPVLDADAGSRVLQVMQHAITRSDDASRRRLGGLGSKMRQESQDRWRSRPCSAMLRNVPPCMLSSGWQSIVDLVRRPPRRSPPGSTEKWEARMSTYLCGEDGVYAVALGGNGGGEAILYRDVVQRLAGQLLTHAGVGLDSYNVETLLPGGEAFRELARAGGEVDDPGALDAVDLGRNQEHVQRLRRVRGPVLVIELGLGEAIKSFAAEGHGAGSTVSCAAQAGGRRRERARVAGGARGGGDAVYRRLRWGWLVFLVVQFEILGPRLLDREQ